MDMSGGVVSQRALVWTGGLLVSVTWASAAIFGLFIIAYYGGAAAAGTAGEKWNLILPRLYEADRPAANAAIGLHFILGAVILLLGPIQLLGHVRRRFPAFHRWTGRLYIGSVLITALGGLTFIVLKGTVGGPPMTAGFALYGVLMLGAGVQTLRYAVMRNITVHRRWAVRLFALAIGSWLYRMEYGFWFAATPGPPGTGPGHTENFTGWFDVFMSYFFFLPNLVVAELYLRGTVTPAGAALRASAALLLLGAAGVVAMGTYFFIRHVWGPPILALFS